MPIKRNPKIKPARKQNTGLFQRIKWKEEEWGNRSTKYFVEKGIRSKTGYLRLLEKEQRFWGKAYAGYMQKAKQATDPLEKGTYKRAMKACERNFNELRGLIDGRNGVKQQIIEEIRNSK